MRSFLALLVAPLLALPACHIDDPSDHPCPPGGTTLTYQDFGARFFAEYCVHCHGGPNSYSSRAFVTVESIRSQRDSIYRNAARGNDAMPPGPDEIPAAERERLGEWLSCGAP